VLKIPAAPGKPKGPPETPNKKAVRFELLSLAAPRQRMAGGSSKAPIIPYPAPRGARRSVRPRPRAKAAEKA